MIGTTPVKHRATDETLHSSPNHSVPKVRGDTTTGAPTASTAQLRQDLYLPGSNEQDQLLLKAADHPYRLSGNTHQALRALGTGWSASCTAAYAITTNMTSRPRLSRPC